MKKVFSVILKFVLAVFLIVLVSISILKTTLLNKEYVERVLDDNKYYEKLSLSTKEAMSKYLTQSGFPDEILENVYTQDDVRADVGELIDQVYSNKEIALDTTRLEKGLRSGINSYFEDKNIKLISSKKIDEFVTMMTDVYKEEVGIVEYLSPLQNVVVNANKYIMPVFIILTVLSIVIIVTLFLLKSKSIISIPLLTLSIVYFIIFFYLKNIIDIDNLLVLSKEISDIVKYVFLDISEIVKNIAIVSFVVSIILIVWRKICKKA